MIPFQMLLATPLGWVEREQHDVIALLREESRVLRTRTKRSSFKPCVT